MEVLADFAGLYFLTAAAAFWGSAISPPPSDSRIATASASEQPAPDYSEAGCWLRVARTEERKGRLQADPPTSAKAGPYVNRRLAISVEADS